MIDICLPADLGTLVLPKTGNYTVEVASEKGRRSSGSFGSYLLTISEEPACTEIEVPTSVNSTLGADDLLSVFGEFVDCYSFSGNAGQQISIRMRSGDFDTSLSLDGPDGLLAVNFTCPGDGTNSCIPNDTLQGGLISLPSAGRYIIFTRSSGRRTPGNYLLTISEGE